MKRKSAPWRPMSTVSAAANNTLAPLALRRGATHQTDGSAFACLSAQAPAPRPVRAFLGWPVLLFFPAFPSGPGSRASNGPYFFFAVKKPTLQMNFLTHVKVGSFRA